MIRRSAREPAATRRNEMFITSMKSYTAFLKEDADAVATALAADPEETETFVVTY